jgi:rhodanese-related sulfurtransferase
MSDEVMRACKSFLDSVPPDLNYITPGELRQRQSESPDSVFLLDNRTPDAYARGHVPGAVNIWMKELLEPKNLAKLPRDRQIVVICWVGHTASQVLTVLQLLGFDAIGMKYGMGEPAIPGERRDGWLDLGFPLETDENQRDDVN